MLRSMGLGERGDGAMGLGGRVDGLGGSGLGAMC